MSEEEIQSDEPIIPEADFREAIAACRQDPELDRYFKLAPYGARLFIGLGFYSTHFGEKTDTAQYKACLDEIEPSLTPGDLKYLIRFERDEKTKKYLKDLLARREAEAAETAAAAAAAVQPEEPGSTGEAPARHPSLRQRLDLNPAEISRPVLPAPYGVSSINSLKLVADGEASNPGKLVLPIAICIGIVGLIAGLFLVHSRIKVGQELGRRNEDVVNLQRRIGQLEQELDRVRMELRKAQTSAKTNAYKPPALRADEGEYVAEKMEDVVPAASVDNANQTEDLPVEKGNEAEKGKVAAAASPKVKVVFTDGRSIVRRQNGKLIEVPRVFSYTGAGLKKPFWIYDRKLGEAKMEVEARLEKQARDAWYALYEEASRQNGSATP